MFAAAVWLRLRSLETAHDVVQTASAANGVATALEDSSTPGSTSSEEYTIVAADSKRQHETSAQRSARERRYEELLRAAPPPGPSSGAAKPAEPASLLNRMVSPVANALGINRPKPQPQAPPPGGARPSPRAANEERAPKTTTADESREPQAEDDPETDLLPPQLLTAEFVPSQVKDGEETVFAVMVNDNLSGVRSVSGVIASPSGSLQGFACTREGESNRYVARITVPKDAPEGTWQVRYMTLSDNASNTVNLNQAQGSLPQSASFRVVSDAPDSSGPQLVRVWVDREAMRAGDKNTVFVQAEDEKSGVSLVSGVFVSPAKAARIGFGCRAGANGTWECPLSPPSCLDCGNWMLEQIQLQDKANNMTTFRGDNQQVRSVALNISSDQCDASAPQVTMLTLDPTVVSNAQVTVITVQATMIDEGPCGSASLSAQAIPPGGVGGQRRPVTFMPSTDGQTFVGRLEIQQFAAKGLWTIAWVQALDKGLNLRAYTTNDPVVARATFRVE
ncbi:MAG: hypothetical protein M3P06_20735 [Acidobacteriota bacterium]|nr:hypothetical protein [Acidobacteriota bacterium]